MGVLSSLRDLNRMGRELQRDHDVSASLQQASAAMAAAHDTLARQAAAASLPGPAHPATVAAARDTGMVVNHQPVLELDLLVLPAGSPPRPVTVREVVAHAHLGRVVPGAAVGVRLDPATGAAALDWTAPAG